MLLQVAKIDCLVEDIFHTVRVKVGAKLWSARSFCLVRWAERYFGG